jgi:hypothetical protein
MAFLYFCLLSWSSMLYGIVPHSVKPPKHKYRNRTFWLHLNTFPAYSNAPLGRVIAQAVCHWLPTAAARVRVRVWSSGICGGQNGAGAGFLRVLRFPLPIFIPPIAPQSPSSIIWGCTIGQKWPQYLVT